MAKIIQNERDAVDQAVELVTAIRTRLGLRSDAVAHDASEQVQKTLTSLKDLRDALIKL